MKFRTDFVTNSSSSGFVALHKLESKTLNRLAEESGVDLDELFESYVDYNEYGGIGIKPIASDTIVDILDDVIESEYDDNDDNIEGYELLKKKINKNKTTINKEITIDIEDASLDTEAGILCGYHLSLINGKGEYRSIYCMGEVVGSLYSDVVDNLSNYGDLSIIENGKVIKTEPICKEDFIVLGYDPIYLIKYRGNSSASRIVIPFKDCTSVVFNSDQVFCDLDGYYSQNGNQKLETVVISDGIESFRDNGQLKEFSFTYIFPASLTTIDIECDQDKVKISAPVGSYAETYAKENGFKFVPLTE